MSYVDVGKAAKRKGALHPKHARRIDPDPERALRKPTGKAKRKAYGFTIEYRHWRTGEWERQVYSWHDTPESRDQALAAFRKKQGAGFWLKYYRDPRPVERTGLSAQGEGT